MSAKLIARTIVVFVLMLTLFCAAVWPDPDGNGGGYWYSLLAYLLIFAVYLPLIALFIVGLSISAAIFHPVIGLTLGAFGFGYWRLFRALRGDRERPADLARTTESREPRRITYQPRD